MERKDYTTTIQELLKGIDSEFDNTSRRCIKMLRHADSRTKLGKEEEQTKLFINGSPFPTNITSIYALYVYRKDLFLQYQSEQLARNMRNIKYLVSFIGEEKKTARFVGVYKINGKRDNPKVKDEVILDLEQIKAFEHLEKRIVIDWATPTNSWHQYFDIEKQARIEKYIQEQGNVPLFESYLRTNLNHAQLKLVVQHPDWVTMLKDVNCIYCILDTSNGKLYVGSTYNNLGILGRWVQYAATGHGGDLDLEKKGEDYCKTNLRWSILETLPLDVSAHDAIECETLWKEKLGVRRFGYCNN